MLVDLHRACLGWLNGTKDAGEADFQALFARLPESRRKKYEKLRDEPHKDMSGWEKRIWAIGQACLD